MSAETDEDARVEALIADADWCEECAMPIGCGWCEGCIAAAGGDEDSGLLGEGIP